MNNTSDENEVMIGKLNKELESLRTEIMELKCRLAKYEGKHTDSSIDNMMLEDVMFMLKRQQSYLYSANVKGLTSLIKQGYRTLGDCRELSIYDIINLPRVAPASAAVAIVTLEHFGIIKVGDFSVSKVTKNHQNYYNFMKLIDNCRKEFPF